MANWCNVTYKCIGNKKELNKLYKVLEKMNKRNKPIIENDWGTMWLGELLNEMDYDVAQCHCRGVITEYYFEDDYLIIKQDTLGYECEDVRYSIEETFDGVEVYYQSFDGCFLRTNSFDYFEDRYAVNLGQGDGDMRFDEIDDVIDYFAKCGYDIEDSDDARRIVETIEEDGDYDSDVYFTCAELTD